MKLGLNDEERVALEGLAEGPASPVSRAAGILLAIDEGASCRSAGEEFGVSGAFTHQVCRKFIDGGRMGCPPLQSKDALGRDKRGRAGRDSS